jgi:hypothetical protein
MPWSKGRQSMIQNGLLRGTYPSDSDDIIVGVRLGELREAQKEIDSARLRYGICGRRTDQG